jgi:murein DD-endopeptidase MepM/ murein hydrolase activator NlpD
MNFLGRMKARWRSFSREADEGRQASIELWSLIRAAGMDDRPGAELPRFDWPLTGHVTSRFGMRDGRMHEGIDIAAAVGTPVHAALGGVVLLASELSVYGNLVVVGHGRSLATVYAHLETVEIAQDEAVAPRQRLGSVGLTGRSFGPHLHFEARFEGTAVDPLVYLQAPGGS